MEKKSLFLEIKDEVQTFTESCNTAEDFMITQNQVIVAGL